MQETDVNSSINVNSNASTMVTVTTNGNRNDNDDDKDNDDDSFDLEFDDDFDDTIQAIDDTNKDYEKPNSDILTIDPGEINSSPQNASDENGI